MTDVRTDTRNWPASYDASRTADAIDQLRRYGDSLERLELVELLETITDLNDDLAHGRGSDAYLVHVATMLETLDRIVVRLGGKSGK